MEESLICIFPGSGQARDARNLPLVQGFEARRQELSHGQAVIADERGKWSCSARHWNWSCR